MYPVAKDSPVYRKFGSEGHVGVDWVVPVGTSVLAILDGVVIESAEDSKTYGRYLMIRHNDGYASLYAHLSKLNAKRGDSVQAGDVIGLSGGAVGADGSGASTGWHLHFEVRPPECLWLNWNNVDPIEYIEKYDSLKPCPFCGGKAVWAVDTGGQFDESYIGCENLCVDVNMNDPADWNKRPLEDALEAEVHRLMEENAKLLEEINRVAPYLAVHGVSGYTIMDGDECLIK